VAVGFVGRHGECPLLVGVFLSEVELIRSFAPACVEPHFEAPLWCLAGRFVVLSSRLGCRLVGGVGEYPRLMGAVGCGEGFADALQLLLWFVSSPTLRHP
jgi:hypothetical protein